MGQKMIKRKLTITGFFVAIILLAQLTVVMPSVVADDDDDHEGKIKLNNDDLDRFENAIENLSGTDLYDSLKSIKEENINEKNEFSVSGLHDMILFLNNSLDESILYSNDIISNVNEMLSVIIFILTIGIMAIPVTVIVLIIVDMIELLQNFAELVFDVAIMIYIPYLGLIPGLFLLVEDLDNLIDHFMDIPMNGDERKAYIRQKFKDARSLVFKLMVLYTADMVFNNYVKPSMGYIGKSAEYLFNICYYSARVVQDGIIQIEWFKTIFIEPAKAFFDFLKTKGLEKIQKLIVLGTSFFEAIRAADDWIWEVGIWIALGFPYPDLMDLSNLVWYLQDAYNYYSSEPKPWLRPITVYVEISNEEDEEVTVTFADPIQDDSATFKGSKVCSLTYYTNTNATENPASSHTIVVNVEEDGKVKTAETSAFSDGEAKIEFTFQKNKGKSCFKSTRPLSSLTIKLIAFLDSFQNFISKIFLERFGYKDLI